MAIAKHKLTIGSDKISGGAGADLFIGLLKNGDATLNGNDRLNGGGGIDTIRAVLVDVSSFDPLTPVMKNIERGIFLTTGVSQTYLDLANAAQLSDVTFQENGKHQGSVVQLEHAAHVASVAARKTDSGLYTLDNADPAKVRDLDISFDTTANTEISIIADTDAVFHSLHVDLSSAYASTISGNATAAKELILNSLGEAENDLSFDPDMNATFTRKLVIAGTQDLNLSSGTGALSHLRSYDASGMTATLWSSIGGEHLRDVVGGNGTDILNISSIGGAKAAPAQVRLGGNYDILTLAYAFDAATQHYDGGKGFDTIAFVGAAADLNEAAKRFEEVDVMSATGLYEVKGMHLTNFLIKSTATATTVDQLADKATLVIYGNISAFLTVNVAHADSSTTDSMRVLLQDSVTLGTKFAGLMTPGLSNLQIDCYTDDHVMYLGTVGSASDPASVAITGAQHLELHASNGSTSYISHLTISNGSAGADISGLADGIQAFVASGATILGGDGSDILVGGAGADHIFTGGGDNTVIGSLGTDVVTLKANSGLDMLVFNTRSQSACGTADQVDNFGPLDGIDISDIASNVQFVGNFSTIQAGVAALSSTHTSAYFNTADHTLYIDLNHDKAFGSLDDMAIKLNGVDEFQNYQLIS